MERHEKDREFRFMYYKFVVLCDLILAAEKYARNKKMGDEELPDSISIHFLACDLSTALCGHLERSLFDQAADVIKDFLSKDPP